MSNQSPTIVFFGSGPVAARSLSLLTSNFKIEAVITKPTTAHEMKESAVNIPIYLANNQKELDHLLDSVQFKSSLGILIDFGIMISQKVIDCFPLGIINSHFSLLPEWRGPDPITFAILSGQKQTGVSLMLLTKQMDKGPILAQAMYDIPNDSDTPELTIALIELSDAMLKTIVPMYQDNAIILLPQRKVSIIGDKTASSSNKLVKNDGLIDWTKPAVQLEREVRAFIEWPKSRTMLADREVIITKAIVSNKQGQPGTILVTGEQLCIHCGDGSLEVQQLKPAGRSAMSAHAFLAGYGQYL
ncbi:MAG: methionyl-tRNA formyltransferase [Candidatus Saccharimonadales bacterium]